MIATRVAAIILFLVCNLVARADNKSTEIAFADSVRHFEIDHDTAALRRACEVALSENSRLDLALFYLGVLNEADERWAAARVDFEQFLDSGSSNEGLKEKAMAEIKKLPSLIAEDSTSDGKTARHYREHLAVAKYLDAQGFAKEAFLEAGTAAKLAPDRWQAYAMASVILLHQDRQTEARHFYDLAAARAPSSSQAELNALSAAINKPATNNAAQTQTTK